MFSLLRKPILKRRRMYAAAISIMLSTMLFFCVVSTLAFIGKSSKEYLGGENVFVLTETGATTFRDTFLSLELAENLETLEGINLVSPESFYYETLQGEPVIIRAVTPTFFQLENLKDLHVEGRVLEDADLNTAVIGSEISRQFQLHIGDSFIIPDPVHASYIEFTVVGIFSGKGFLDSEIIIPLETGWILAHYPRMGKVSIIRVQIDPLVWPTYDVLYTTLKEPPAIAVHPYDGTGIIAGTVKDTVGVATVVMYFQKNDEWRKRPAEITGSTFTVEIPKESKEYYITAVDLFGNITSTTVQKVTPVEVTDVLYEITPENPTETDDVRITCFSDAETVHLYYTLQGMWSEVEMQKKGESFGYYLGTLKGDLLFYFLLEKDGIEYESTIHTLTIVKPEEIGFIQKLFQREESTVTKTEIIFEGITSDFDIHSSGEFSEEVKEVSLGKLYTLTVVILLVTILATVFAIISSVTAVVFESRREIGILLSLGSKKRVLYVIFLVNSLVISLAAGVLGSLGGYGLLLLFHKYGTITAGTVLIQPVFEVQIVLFSLLFAVTLGFVATFVSVRTISSMDPSEALKRVYTPTEKVRKMKEIELPKFTVKMSGFILFLIFLMSLLLHVYPTVLTKLPFDPDSWSHYVLSQEIVATGHLPVDHPFFYVDYNTNWPGLNIVLAECTLLGVNPLDAARFCIPLISACSLVLVYVIAKYVSRSRAAGVVSAAVFSVGGLYINRSSSLTKESLAFTLLLFCMYVYFVGRTEKNVKMMVLAFPAYLCLVFTHHISTVVYILVVLSVAIPLTLYELYHGLFKKRTGVLDVIFVCYIILLFYQVEMKIPIDYLQFSSSDLILLLSYLLVVGSIITYLALKGSSRRIVYLSIFSVIFLAVLPYFIVYLGVYPSAPEAFLKEAPPYVLLVVLGIISFIPVLTFPFKRRLLLSGWLIGIVSFLLFALTRERSTFSFLLLFRTLSYGYQLLSVLCGISIVFVVQKLFSVSKYLVIPFVFLMIGLSFYTAQSGYLGNYYEQKDLYWMPEYYSGLWVKDHLSGILLTDERLGKMFQGVSNIDYDLIAFSQLMVKGEKSHGFAVVYTNMYTYGFVADVNFIVPQENLEDSDCVYANKIVKIYDLID